MGAHTFQNASPDRRGHGWLGANHAVDVDVDGIAAAKSLRMLDGAAHAHSAYELVHRFGKWPAQEAHTRGVAKRRNTAAGTDDNAATPQLVMALTCLVQTNGGPARLLSVLLCGSNHGIDTRSRTAKALKRLLEAVNVSSSATSSMASTMPSATLPASFAFKSTGRGSTVPENRA